MPISKPDRIKEIRIKQGYSIRAISLKAGLNYATVSYLEKTPRSVAPRTAKMLCDALGVPFDEVFTIANIGSKE
ncbi:MAG: helix-turn-helix transcriptional regulator [Oscillospiraceae bacterium]|nr:helix-turn-helix transcriptional regulator [Oscillospiraceae bacterium]